MQNQPARLRQVWGWRSWQYHELKTTHKDYQDLAQNLKQNYNNMPHRLTDTPPRYQDQLVGHNFVYVQYHIELHLEQEDHL